MNFQFSKYQKKKNEFSHFKLSKKKKMNFQISNYKKKNQINKITKRVKMA